MNMESLPDKARTVMAVYTFFGVLAPYLGFFFAMYREELVLYALFLLALLSLIAYFYSRTYFKNYRYYVTEREIVVKKGAVFKRRCLIVRDKIAAVSITQGILQRRFGLCTVWLHIPGGIVKLSHIKRDRAESLCQL